MKVDSKHIMPFLQTISVLLKDYEEGFRECEDVEQCRDVFLYVKEQIDTVVNTFKVDYLVPLTKPSEQVPYFVKAYERTHLGRDSTGPVGDHELQQQFMYNFYFAVKRKIVNDGVDHFYTRDKIEFHIRQYLVMNDVKWSRYFDTNLADAADRVLDTIVNEIMEERRKHPQFELQLEPPARDETLGERRLLDVL